MNRILKRAKNTNSFLINFILEKQNWRCYIIKRCCW